MIMSDRQSDQGGQGAGRPNGAGQNGGAEIIPFRRPARPPAPKPPGRGPVIGPRSKLQRKLRLAEAFAFGLFFSLVTFLLEPPLAALPFAGLGFALAASLWFAISPRRGSIDNGTVIVAALAAALTGWLGYAAIKSVVAGGGLLTVFSTFVSGLSYAVVVAWPVGIAAGLIVRRLSAQWRPQGRG